MTFLGQDRWQRALFFLKGGHRTFIFSAVIFLLSAGFAFGVETSSALLVSRVGAAPLFYVYLGSALLTLLISACIYLWIDRFSRLGVLFFSFELFALGSLFAWFYLRGEGPLLWPYYAARIFFDAVFVLALLQFWLVASDSFTNFEAKLRYPIFVAAAVLGNLAGNGILQEFAPAFRAVNFFILCFGILFFSPFLLLFIKSRAGETPPESWLKGRLSRQTMASLPASTFRLFYLLLFFWLAYTFFSYGVDYLFNRTVIQKIPDENELASFFGEVGFISLGVVFFYQIFLAGRFEAWFGVNRLVAFTGFLFFGGMSLVYFSPSLAAMAFTEGLFVFFIDFAATTFLEPVTNLFPDRFRGRMKVLIDGFGRPFGSLLLLVFALAVSWKWDLGKMSLVLWIGASLFLLYPFFFKKAYLRYLLDCLQSHDLKTVLNGIQALGERGHRPAAEVLLRLLETTDTMTVKRNVVLSLGRMRAEKALPKVIEQFSIPVESLQLAVLESLSLYRNYESLFALYEFMRSQENVSFQVRMNATYLMTRLVGKRMIPLLKEALNEEDFRIKANALESIALLKEREMIPLVLPYLHHTSRRLRANAAICLYPFRPQRNETRKTIDALFRSEDPLTRFSGIYAIGELELTEYRRPLIELLENPDLRYRQNVITALAKMRIPGYPEEFVQMLLDPDDEVALGSVRRLGRFSKYSRWRIFEIVSHRPAFERRKIIQRLEQTPLDFSEEKELLETHLSPPPSHPL